MEEKEFNTTFAIPANYTDSGKIFGGMLEPRNAVDGDSLFQYAGHIICYLAHRRKLHLRRVGYKYDQRQLRKKKSRKKKA